MVSLFMGKDERDKNMLCIANAILNLAILVGGQIFRGCLVIKP